MDLCISLPWNRYNVYRRSENRCTNNASSRLSRECTSSRIACASVMGGISMSGDRENPGNPGRYSEHIQDDGSLDRDRKEVEALWHGALLN